jgi:hypothetical protein
MGPASTGLVVALSEEGLVIDDGFGVPPMTVDEYETRLPRKAKPVYVAKRLSDLVSGI